MIRYEPVGIRHALSSLGIPPTHWWHPITGSAATIAMVCASGAHGLIQALSSIGGSGPVIVPAYTCDRVVAAVLAAGDTPRFVDIEERSGSLCLSGTNEAIWSGAKAIIMTPLFGAATDREILLAQAVKNGVATVEDRAITIRVPEDGESAPDYAVYSLGRGKPVSLGVGGVVVAYRGRQLWAPGPVAYEDSSGIGRTSLLRGSLLNGRGALMLSKVVSKIRGGVSDIQAEHRVVDSLGRKDARPSLARAVARFVSQLDLQQLTRSRVEALGNYRWALREAGQFELADSIGARLSGGVISPALALRASDRDQALSDLKRAGIDAPVYWQYAIGQVCSKGDFPGARSLAKQVLFLPLHSGVGRKNALIAARVLSAYEVAAFS